MKRSRADEVTAAAHMKMQRSNAEEVQEGRGRPAVLKQDSAGTSERGLPLGTRGAAIYARDKVVLLGCLPLNPPSFVRYHDFSKLLELFSKRGALACSMILGGLRGCSA